MLVERSSLSQPIRPLQTEMLTRRIAPGLGCLECTGLGDMPGMDELIRQGGEYLNSLVQQAQMGNREAHIAAQNRAGSDMNAVVTAYHGIKDQGLLTLSTILQAQTALRQIVQNFCDFTRQVGTQRAVTGCNDLTRYGNIAINDMENDKNLLGYAPGIPTVTPGGLVIGGTTGNVPGLVTAAKDYLPLLLGAAFLFFIPKGGRGAR